MNSSCRPSRRRHSTYPCGPSQIGPVDGLFIIEAVAPQQTPIKPELRLARARCHRPAVCSQIPVVTHWHSVALTGRGRHDCGGHRVVTERTCTVVRSRRSVLNADAADSIAFLLANADARTRHTGGHTSCKLVQGGCVAASSTSSRRSGPISSSNSSAPSSSAMVPAGRGVKRTAPAT